MRNVIEMERNVICARQMAAELIASHLKSWCGRNIEVDEAEEVLEDLQLFGIDEDAELAEEVCLHPACQFSVI